MAKAVVKVNFNRVQIQQGVTDRIDAVRNDEGLKREIGEFSAERIRFQARIGQPLNSEGRFKALAPLTVESRRRLERYNVVASTYGPSRSNLTLTGQFLNSLTFKSIKNGIEFVFEGLRKPYRYGNGGQERNPPTNEELNGYLRRLGFDVYTKRGIEGNALFQAQVRRIIEAFFRRKL